jgi:DNA-binding response OmpR family regulator
MAPIPRILIVEDDEIISNLIAIMLEKKGYGITGRLISGEDAIIKAAELQPDLVIMDINLCGLLDGVEAAKYIFQLFQIPIIFLTGLFDETLVERAKSSQPYGYIMKPFSDKELTANVELALFNHNIRKKFFDAYPVSSPKKLLEAMEAAIITDTKGRIVFYNPYSTRLLDLPANKMQMSPLRDIVTFINDQTGEPFEDLVPEVVRQMLVVSHEFNTELVTKSGKHRKVSVTARPVKDNHNGLLAVFVHMKEKTLDQIKMAKK